MLGQNKRDVSIKKSAQMNFFLFCYLLLHSLVYKESSGTKISRAVCLSSRVGNQLSGMTEHLIHCATEVTKKGEEISLKTRFLSHKMYFTKKKNRQVVV